MTGEVEDKTRDRAEVVSPAVDRFGSPCASDLGVRRELSRAAESLRN